MSVGYAKCLFCGMTRPVRSKRYDDGFLQLGDLDVSPSEYPVIQLREIMPGPGRGHKGKGIGGWPVVDSLSMKEALEDDTYGDLASQMRDRLVAIVNDYLRAGIIDISELHL